MIRVLSRLTVARQVLVILLTAVFIQSLVLQVFTQQERVDDELEHSIEAIRDKFILTHDVIEYLVMDGEEEEIRKFLLLLNTDPDVVQVALVNGQGIVQVATDGKYRNKTINGIFSDYSAFSLQEELQKTRDSQRALFSHYREDDNLLLMMAPVQFSRFKVAAQETHELVLIADLAHHKSVIMYKSYRSFFVQVGVMLFASIVLLILFQRSVQKRLTRLIEGLQDFARGQLPKPIDRDGADEISQLSNEANRLIEQLVSSRNETLKQKEYFEAVFASMSTAAVIVDHRGLILSCNEQAESLAIDCVIAHHQPFMRYFPVALTRSGGELWDPLEVSGKAEVKGFLQLDTGPLRVNVTVSDLNQRFIPGGEKIILISDEQLEFELQERLQENEQKLSRILENIPGPVLVYENRGPIQFYNQAAKTLFGLSSDIYDYQRLQSTLPDLLRQHLQIREGDIVKGKLFKREELTLKIDEQQHCFSVTLFPVSSRTSSEIFVACIMLDISEEMRNRQALLGSKQHLQSFVSNSPTPIIEWDPEFRVCFWNIAAEKLFGDEADVALGGTLLELLQCKDPGKFRAHLENVVSGDKNESGAIPFVTQQGQMKLTEWTSFWVSGEGEDIRFASLITDVTAMQEMINNICLKEAEKDEVLRSMVEPVITIDEKGIILTFNQAAEEKFGYGSEQVIGRNVNMLMPQTVARQHDGFLKHYMQTGEKRIIGTGREVQGQKADGSLFTMYLSVSELPLQQNGVRRFIGNCVDLTVLRDKERQLNRAVKMDALGKLTGGIAHDFNNILGIMLGYCDLLMLNEHLADADKDALAEIRKAGDRATNLTGKLLNFSKKGSGISSEANLNTLILENKMILEKSLKPGVTLKLNLCERTPTVRLDINDFEDAILNLVINANQAIAESGVITITTYLLEQVKFSQNNVVSDCMVCEVSDNGPGIPEDCQERIFEPFYSTKGEKGTGLGLSQVYGFVKRSEGMIELSSSAQGTSIQMLFPIAVQGKDAGKVKIVEDKKATFAPNTSVLVVDDETGLTEVISAILKNEGLSVSTANSGEEALNIMQNQAFSLVLSDVVMPEMDGFKLAKLVKERYPDMPILMMSGYLDTKLIPDMDEALLANLVSKPFTPQTLLRAISNALG